MNRTDICNLALDHLREAPIGHIDADGSVSEWFQRNFDAVLDGVLRDHPWNFAITRASIAVDGTAPDFGWTYRYALPTDCVRLLQIRSGGYLNGAPVEHEIEGEYILTNAPTPLKIRYIKTMSDPSKWDALFVEAMAAALALKMSHWLTGKTSYVQMAKALYDEALAKAKRVDGMEGTPEAIYADDVIGVRYV